ATRLAAVDTGRALRAGVERAGMRLAHDGQRLEDAHPGRLVARARQRLESLDWRRPYWERLGRASGRLEADAKHVTALSPQRTLERGYAVVRGPDGTVLRKASAVVAGDRIDVRVADGRLSALVEDAAVEEADER
ncbi:MAG: hypothetical protein J2P57_13525, partial [Acidimicrobiaceae bacterium]|nr:hypothetical protein [Acidimicrobiaceae bacterium]